MSPLAFATGVTPKEVADALVAVEKRVTANETRLAAVEKLARATADDLAALRAQMVKGDELRARLADLEGLSDEAFDRVAENTRALRAILTLLHPDEDHPPVTDEVVPGGAWLHDLVMYWIARYGGRVEEGEAL